MPADAVEPRRDAIQATLTKTRIAPDLLATMRVREATAPDLGSAALRGAAVDIARPIAAGLQLYDVIVEFNMFRPGGARAARDRFFEDFEWWRTAGKRKRDGGRQARAREGSIASAFSVGDEVDIAKSRFTENYAFCRLCRTTIDAVASVEPDPHRTLVYKIWLDHKLSRCVFASTCTIKCDAARAAFAAAGRDVVWAVADTGISGDHPHFLTHDTLELADGLLHYDFTESHPNPGAASKAALVDVDGHGTHVAGIIAGETLTVDASKRRRKISVHREVRMVAGAVTDEILEVDHSISGLAPLCKLLSLKVLKGRDDGPLSNLLAAIGYVQEMNSHGRNLRIHGINLSLGYSFDPEWFGAGQSPLCIEVDRLVRSGVIVVVAAGNGGYGTITTYSGAAERASHSGTIGDPGNADLAITVGSTHRDMPHAYGVSYFSAKGPTADGRMKPDLVAPGERIVSCALPSAAVGSSVPFREESGTSMAAPHVSGAAAAFLSVRGEFKGRPERVKEILLGSAIDLRRRPEFQGAGLVDVMKALQSV